jgi:hypothetical protein
MPEKLGRTVAKVIRNYHPDRAEFLCGHGDDGSTEWFYSEITKFLTTILA